ncbi:transcriptional regulator, partial [Micromonospora globispora]
MTQGTGRPRRRWLLGLAALATVVLVAAGGVLVTRLVSRQAPGPIAGSATPTPATPTSAPVTA